MELNNKILLYSFHFQIERQGRPTQPHVPKLLNNHICELKCDK
jgi:hypothetical protein